MSLLKIVKMSSVIKPPSIFIQNKNWPKNFLFRNFSSQNSENPKTIQYKNFNLKFTFCDLEKKSSEKIIPFLVPTRQLPHILASHFRKQFLAQSFLKDPYHQLNVSILKQHLPFYSFKISAKNLKASLKSSKKVNLMKSSKNLKNSKSSKSFKNGVNLNEIIFSDIELNGENEEMQIFAGNYSKLNTNEVSAMKIRGILENEIDQLPSDLKQSEDEILLKGKEASKKSISSFLKHFEENLKKNFNEKNNENLFDDYEITGKITVDFKLRRHPAYILIFGFWGTTHRLIVNGLTGESSGPFIVSPLKIFLILAGIIFLITLISSPKYVGMDQIFYKAMQFSPLIGIFALFVASRVVSRQIGKNATEREKSYKTLFKTAEEAQRRAFYQNWFLYQNQKEEIFHNWYRQSAFEEQQRRYERYGHFEKSQNYAKNNQNWKNYAKNGQNAEKIAAERFALSKRPLYHILGLKPTASKKMVEKSFRELAKKWHPDKFAHKSEIEKRRAVNKFKDILQAYNVLRDERKRQNYDLTGEADS